MSNPLTPRLELVRAVLEAIAGTPFTDLAEILNAIGVIDLKVSGALVTLDQTNAYLDKLTVVPSEPQLPSDASSWPVGNYLLWLGIRQLLEQELTGLAAFTAAWQGQAPTQGTLEDYLIAFDTALSGIQVNVSQTNSNTASMIVELQTLNNNLAALVDCLCDNGGGGAPVFPETECTSYPDRYRLVMTNWVTGSYSSVLPYVAFGLGESAANPTVAVSAFTGAAGTWFAFGSDVLPRTVCFAWSHVTPPANAFLRVWRIIGPRDGPPAMNWANFFQHDSFDASAATGSHTMALQDESSLGELERFWYGVVLEAPDGYDIAAGGPPFGLWVNFGGAG